MSVYTLPDLAYDPAALEPHLSAAIVELHHAKHHATYVKGANTAIEQLDEARAAGRWADLPGLEHTLAFNLGGHVLHSIYWTNLSPSGGGEPTGALAEAVGATFGSFADFKALFHQATLTVQGSGWGILGYEPLGRRLVVQQLLTHQDNHLLGAVPLLAIDAWEHAYYLQYQNVRADYLTALWNVIDWSDVSRRFAIASAA
jgi:Fe-Mn family superoxide dismutase